jgi:hypothetical protein
MYYFLAVRTLAAGGSPTDTPHTHHLALRKLNAVTPITQEGDSRREKALLIIHSRSFSLRAFRLSPLPQKAFIAVLMGLFKAVSCPVLDTVPAKIPYPAKEFAPRHMAQYHFGQRFNAWWFKGL